MLGGGGLGGAEDGAPVSCPRDSVLDRPSAVLAVGRQALLEPGGDQVAGWPGEGGMEGLRSRQECPGGAKDWPQEYGPIRVDERDIWIIATYYVVGHQDSHLRYRRSITTTSCLTPTISYV